MAAKERRSRVLDRLRCACCKRVLPRTEFNKNSSRRTGLQAYCHQCKYEANKESRKRRPPSVVPNKKRCSKCDRVRKAAEFYRDSCQKSGLTS